MGLLVVLPPADAERRGYTGLVPDDIAPLELEPDPVIEAYKVHVDRTLIRERLARTAAERVADLVELARFAEELKRAGANLRGDG